MEGDVRQSAAERYEIRVKGHLDQRWSDWFEGLEIRRLPAGITVLAGPVADQAALQGMLNWIGDLGLTLLLVRRQDEESSGAIEPERT